MEKLNAYNIRLQVNTMQLSWVFFTNIYLKSYRKDYDLKMTIKISGILSAWN